MTTRTRRAWWAAAALPLVVGVGALGVLGAQGAPDAPVIAESVGPGPRDADDGAARSPGTDDASVGAGRAGQVPTDRDVEASTDTGDDGTEAAGDETGAAPGAVTAEQVPAPSSAEPAPAPATPAPAPASPAPAPAPAPAPPAPSSGTRDVESRLLALANDARRAAGLAPLQAHDGLTSVARAWSERLAAAGSRLAHNPDYATQVPGGWSAVGENVAWIDDGGTLSPEEVARRMHQGWMDSAGHRENILRPGYTHLGVGVGHNPEHGWYLTQNFATY